MDAILQKRELLDAVGAADAYGEIQNTMGRAAAAFMFHQAEKIKSLFCLEGDVTLTFPGMEMQRGPEAVAAAIDRLAGETLKPGEMTDSHLCSPIMTPGPDGKTAHGSWEVISAIGEPAPDLPEKARALWGFGKLEADFIYRDGQWLITALCYERRIRCDYDLGWAKEVQA